MLYLASHVGSDLPPQSMDRLSSQQIKELWVEHFPKRLDDMSSRAVLENLVTVVLERAHEGETYYTLRALGISKLEFDRFRAEQNLPSRSMLGSPPPGSREKTLKITLLQAIHSIH